MTINNALQAVDDLLHSITASSVSLLHETSLHILGAGGKRLRPRLVLLAYQAAGGERFEEAVPLAAAVEIIHTATLVHDDINDHGTLRRGRETVNARWGRTYALLTGDYMFTKAYQLMLPYPLEFNSLLAHAAVELVEGETLQIKASKEGLFSREVYFEIIAKKTASLFVAATLLGASAAHAAPGWADALRKYAFNLGLAFQITDDVLDLVADTQQLGKNAGIDVMQGRGIALAMAGRDTLGFIAPTTLADLDDGIPLDAFQESILAAPTLDEAIRKGRDKAHELADLAAASLNVLPPSPAVEELRALSRQVVERNH